MTTEERLDKLEAEIDIAKKADQWLYQFIQNISTTSGAAVLLISKELKALN